MNKYDSLKIMMDLDFQGARRDLGQSLKDLILRAQRMQEDLANGEHLEITLMKNRAEIDVLADRVNRCSTFMIILNSEEPTPEEPTAAPVSSATARVRGGGGRRA